MKLTLEQVGKYALASTISEGGNPFGAPGRGGTAHPGWAVSTANGRSRLAILLAVCKAESGLDPNAVHHNTDGSIDVGLAQINSVHFSTLGLTEAELKDPETNLKAAFSISKAGTSFGPWVTYTTGAYLVYLPAAKLAVNSLAASGHSDPIGAVTGAAGSLAQHIPGVSQAESVAGFLGKLGQTQTWIRVLEVMGGGIFILAGLALLFRELGATQVATEIAKVTPVGKVASVGGSLAKTAGGHAKAAAKQAAKGGTS